MNGWLLRIASIAALLGLAAAVWYAGPLIGFGDARPLAPAWVRLLVIATLVLALGGYYLLRFFRARSAERALEAASSRSADRDGDALALERSMQKAIEALRRASGRRNFLYEVPWYVIIGPPGAGKTTALVNSGLNFPLSVSGSAQPVPGVGGTRNCDWWFTDKAVLIDTAGRFATQDSDPSRDRRDWLDFLSLLKKYRASQPINGVIVAVSLSDLMTTKDGLAGQVTDLRSRLREMHETLKITFPVYILFTKADLIAGFMEYFGNFDEMRRRIVWGATFQTTDLQANLVGDAPAEFEELARRLSEDLPDRLQEEPDPVVRISIFGFPAQFASLRQRCTDLLSRIFPPEKGAGFLPRGFYFSSGTQEGTPFDRILGTMGRSFGAVPQLSGTGKSFFLHDLLAKVVFAESGWVSFDKSAERRARLGRFAGITAVGLGIAAALGALGVSFKANRELVASTDAAAETYRKAAGAELTGQSIADADLGAVIDALEAVRSLPAGYEYREQPVLPQETLGMSQRERLQSASVSAYRQALERMFRPRLLLQLEQTIEAGIGDPAALYEPLKTYLMLGGKAPKVDDDAIVAWLTRDWETNRYPGSQNREGRTALEKHLRAMLALDDEYDVAVELNRPLVESAQRSLGRLTVADRASALIAAASVAAPPDFAIAAKAGPEAQLVFETVDGSELSALRVPGIYTYSGFRDFYLEQLSTVAQKLGDEQWVIGSGGEQGGIEQDLLQLGPDLLDRYSTNFSKAWNDVLDRLKLKSMSADKPKYVTLSAAGAANSPLAQLFEAIARETALTRGTTNTVDDEVQAQGLARIGIETAGRKSASRAGTASSPGEQVPGANIEAQFRPFHLLVDGRPGQRPIDALIQNFRAMRQSLTIAAAAPSQADRVNANLQLQISNLRANASRLPKQLARMVQAAADDFEVDVASASAAQLGEQLKDTVTGPCQDLIGNRFPFRPSATEDVSIADFARLFGPGGTMDRFFAQNLAQLADTSRQDWSWNQDTQLGRSFSTATLKQFQLAAQIRDAFFPLGGSTPAVNLTFTLLSLHGDADMALLDVNGQVVQSYQTGSSPAVVTWPGTNVAGSAHLSLTPELPGRDSAIKFDGPWALKRLLDTATANRNGDNLELRFVIGGRDVAYTVQVNPPGNPFELPAFSEFACPSDL